jgi:hypothetical protein
MPRRLLGGTAKRKVKRPRMRAGRVDEDESSDDDAETDMFSGGQGQEDPWVQTDPVLLGTQIPAFTPQDLPEEFVAAATNYNAYDYYKLFQPDDYAEMVVEQSKLYGGQKDLHKAVAQVNIDTYRLVISHYFFKFCFPLSDPLFTSPHIHVSTFLAGALRLFSS